MRKSCVLVIFIYTFGFKISSFLSISKQNSKKRLGNVRSHINFRPHKSLPNGEQFFLKKRNVYEQKDSLQRK